MVTAIVLFFVGAAIVGAVSTILQIGFIAIGTAYVASVLGSKK